MFVDEWIGNVLNKLEASEFAHSTAVTLTADHDDMLGDHNLWRKGYPCELCSRMPLFLFVPGMISSVKSFNAPTELLDLFPTFMDLAGAKMTQFNQCLDGKSLSAVFRPEKTGNWRHWIDLEIAQLCM